MSVPGADPAAPRGVPRALVAYGTGHGATKAVAERIAGGLADGGCVADVEAAGDVGGVAGYDAVVLGSAVYNQSWVPAALELARRHAADLAARPVWLFSVASFGDTRRLVGPLMRRSPKQIDELRRLLRPRGYRVFAGVLVRERWPLYGRIFYHAFGGRWGDNRDWAEIDRWAAEIAGGLTAERGGGP